MQTRNEMILDFLKCLAATEAAHRLFDQNDEVLAANMLYLRACRLADAYLERQ